MDPVSIYNPKKLCFGSGCTDRMVSDYIASGRKRIFILSVEPVIHSIEHELKKLKEHGIELHIDTSLSSEPGFTDFHRVLGDARQFGPDSIAGIGGGSVMDLAKLIAAFMDVDEPVENSVGTGLVKSRNTHLVCAPTTSGTGSEVSPNSILLDEEKGHKQGIISELLVPDASYVDPQLTLGLPPDVTAYTGLDALVHCIEAYTNKYSHPVIDTYAIKGISLIYDHLREAVRNGSDLEARTNVALGSMYGGICLGPVNTAAVHALAYPLGSDYRLAHGLSNAILLPYIMEFNLESAVLKYADIARAIGVPGSGSAYDMAYHAVERIRQLLHDCNIPVKLRDLGVKEESLESMAVSAFEVRRLLRNNPREVQVKDAYNIYKNAY